MRTTKVVFVFTILAACVLLGVVEQANASVVGADAATGAAVVTEAISLQVFDQAGWTLWAEATELQEGLRTPAQTFNSWKYGLGVIPNESGGAIAFWNNRWEKLSLEMCSVESDGMLLWRTTDGGFMSSLQEDLDTKVVSDGEGGLFVCALSDSGETTDHRLAWAWVHHISNQGRGVWKNDVTGRIEVGVGELGYSASTDEKEGVIVVWDTPRSHPIAQYAQRLDSVGSRVWRASAGVLIGTTSGMQRWSITPSDDAVFFSIGDEGSTKSESRIQKLDLDGNVLWGVNGIRLDDWRESEAG